MHALTLYLVALLATISPHLQADRRDSIARDVATVALTEERAFGGDGNGQKTSLLLVSLAYYETGRSWAPWVDDGRCNDAVWRIAHEGWLRGGGCDNTRAFGMWQVHPPGDNFAIGRSYVTDRKKGIRAALYIARKSLESGVGLCAYSGEPYPKCPKAKHRLDTAARWVSEFPFDDGAALTMR